MPRAQVPVTASVVRGVVLAAEQDGDTVNNHQLANSGKEKIHVRNANGASTARTVTIKFNRTVQGSAIASIVQAIPAGATWVFGPFPVDDFGSQVQIDVDNAELKLRAVV